jgi:hypothetical protein
MKPDLPPLVLIDDGPAVLVAIVVGSSYSHEFI